MAAWKRLCGAEIVMARWRLFYRMMVRPLFREPVRLGLTVLAVALGVAVVLAIDLAGNAAAGSFQSSMETLAGDNDLEVVAAGGVPEDVVRTLVRLPYAIRVSPRLEDFAVVVESKETLPLIGLDFLAESSQFVSGTVAAANVASSNAAAPTDFRERLKELASPTSVWVGESLGKKPGDKIELLINDQIYLCTVRGVFP